MALDKATPQVMIPMEVASETAPSNPNVGQRWYKASTAVTYQYTNDGTSSFWLDISSGGIGTSSSTNVDYVGDTDPLPTHNGGSATLSIGQVYYNREGNRYFICTKATDNNNIWTGRYAGSGGNRVIIETEGSTYYKIHVFETNGTFTMNDTSTCDILVVGGGGSGAAQESGGGGAGGLIYYPNKSIPSGTHIPIVIGAGGILPNNGHGGNGGNSTFGLPGNTLTALGGGGGNQYGIGAGSGEANGGSGGGAAYTHHTSQGVQQQTNGSNGLTADSRTYGFGNNGGAGNDGGGNNGGAGGGGGAGAAGGAGNSSTGGNGGVGKDYSAKFGTNVGESGWFAGGGGGGRCNGSSSTGGNGGGGDLAKSGIGSTGGGGGGHVCPGTKDGHGGDGVVIVRYALN